MIETFFKKNQGLIWVCSILVGAMVWMFSTFSTISSANEKESSVLKYVDEKHASVENRLDLMEKLLFRIDRNVSDLTRESRHGSKAN